MEMNLGEPGDGPQQNIFDAGLGGCGDRDRIPVAAQSSGYPDDVDILHARSGRHAVPPRALSARDLLRNRT